MGRVADELDIDFVISTGDNFYNDGLQGVTDPQFETSYSNVYTAKSLQKTWYTGRLKNCGVTDDQPLVALHEVSWRCRQRWQTSSPEISFSL